MRLTSIQPSIQPLEDLGVVNYIGLHVWTLAPGGIYDGGKFDIFAWKWLYFKYIWDLEMLKWNISERWIFAFQSALLNIGPPLHYSNGNDTFFFGLFLPWN